MNDEFHEEILQSAPRRFPMESFLQLRRCGISVSAALEALGADYSKLSFVEKALLEVDPNDRVGLRSLGVD